MHRRQRWRQRYGSPWFDPLTSSSFLVGEIEAVERSRLDRRRGPRVVVRLELLGELDVDVGHREPSDAHQGDR